MKNSRLNKHKNKMKSTIATPVTESVKKIPTPPVIQVTYNYGLFKMIAYNRDVTEVRTKNLCESIQEFDLTDCKPIICNQRLEIIDGQGRFKACQRLGYPVYYIVRNVGNRTDDAMERLNASQANWVLEDWIEFYIKKGIPNYVRVKECREKYKITSSIAVMFVSNFQNIDFKIIKQGKLPLGQNPAELYADILEDYGKIFKDYKHIFFVRALMYIINHGYYNHEVDFKKVQKNRADLMGCANKEQYLQMFENILNKMRRGEKLQIMREYNPKKN
jgi:hypothetical protein